MRGSASDFDEDIEETLEVAEDLTVSQLGLSKDTVDEGDRHLFDLVAHVLSAHYDLHLEDIAAALHGLQGLLQDFLLVEAEGAGEVRCRWGQEGGGQEVGDTGGQLTIEIPAIDTAILGIASARHDISTCLLLLLNEFGNDLRVMSEVGVHQNHEIT
jgi:hypothetical protein